MTRNLRVHMRKIAVLPIFVDSESILSMYNLGAHKQIADNIDSESLKISKNAIAHSETLILRISCAVSSCAAAEWAKPSRSAAALRRHGVWDNVFGDSAHILCACGILRIP